MNGSWVKYQLRAYLCRELIQEDLLEQLLYIDDDIEISTMRLSHMPRSNSLPSSTVERQAERREVIREKVNGKIAQFDKSCEHMAKALLSLGDDEYTVVSNSYFSIDYDDDELAQEMEISVVEVRNIRGQALRKLYLQLTSYPTQETCLTA